MPMTLIFACAHLSLSNYFNSKTSGYCFENFCVIFVSSITVNRSFQKSTLTMTDKQKVDLGLLEEDDEFEEFPTENWGTEDADDEEVSVWEDNWEDDVVQDDFNQQLKQQLEKLKEKNKT